MNLPKAALDLTSELARRDTVFGRRLKVRRGTRPKRTLTWSLDFSMESV